MHDSLRILAPRTNNLHSALHSQAARGKLTESLTWSSAYMKVRQWQTSMFREHASMVREHAAGVMRCKRASWLGGGETTAEDL